MKLESPMLTAHEVADLLRVHQLTVYRLIRNGKLHPLQVGHVWRFDREEIESLLAGSAKLP
jgi:excisionase family DNA binding protein